MHTDGYTVFTGPLKHGPKGQKAVKKAEQMGNNVEYVNKNDGPNKSNLDGKYVAKIMNSENDTKPTMPHDLKIAIAQARQAKGWNQEQFSRNVQISKGEIKSWEAGKSVPANMYIAKMQKCLGVKLPRPPKK